MELKDLQQNDIVEFIHPISKKPETGKYGVSRFVRIIQRHNGGKQVDIELVDNLDDKTIIREENIRWDRTEYHKNKVRI